MFVLFKKTAGNRKVPAESNYHLQDCKFGYSE